MRSYRRSVTLDAVLRELWPDPMLAAMPDGTRFDYGVNDDIVWASLVTPWFPQRSYCQITRAECTETARELGSYAFAQLLDERLADLRMRHWLMIFWPDLDEVPA